MKNIIRLAGIFTAMCMVAMCTAVPASAQATRTWISGVGDDANPCSRTAPCKTFPGAISKTAAGGEIDCLDPAGYGAVTITKSITLDCGGGVGGQVGSILVAGTNGITINAASTDIIKIRNLTINGIQKAGTPGLSGIKFNTGAALIIEHVGIFGFGGTPSNYGGVDFEPSTTASLEMNDVEVQYGLGDGVLIKPALTAIASATLNRVTSINNAGSGLRVDTVNSTGTGSATAYVNNGNFSDNAAGITANAPGALVASAQVHNTLVAHNTYFGAVTSGAGTKLITLGGCVVIGNATGVTGIVKSWGDNYVNNTANGTFATPGFTKS